MGEGRSAAVDAEPDIVYMEDFVVDHRSLLDSLCAELTWDERMRARKTASLGAPYNYSGMVYAATAMPDAILRLRDALTDAFPFAPNNCLVNYYVDGSSTMGFHADSILELASGTGVAIVSLGATRTLRFRRILERQVEFARPLPGGSVIYMPPEIQDAWKHGVSREVGAGARISLTFRQIADP